MKKNYFACLFLLIGMMFPATIFATEGNQLIGSPDLQYVPDDWENDLWLNTYFRELHVGDTYQITARRVPEIVENLVSPNVTLPTFHYTVISGSSVTVSDNGLISAQSTGASIIKVSYDEKTAYGKTYGAVSPVNIAYMAVNVVDPAVQNDINITTDIKTQHYDKQYFFGSGIDYTFKASATGADEIQIFCNGLKVTTKKENVNQEQSFVVRLRNRANIIEVRAKNTSNATERAFFYVVNARKIELTLANQTEPARHTPIVGDVIRFSFKGITLPVPKLATIYNPQMENPAWGATAAKVVFNNERDGNEVKTNVALTQYDLATNNTIELTLTQSGEYRFTGGHITESWWGSKLGKELDMTGPGQPNLNAETESGIFSALPAFRIFVASNSTNAGDITLDLNNPTIPESFSFDPDKKMWTETYNPTAYPQITSQCFSFSHLPSQNNWGGTSWEGFTVSRSEDNAVNHEEFPNRQWGCMARGGVEGVGTPYLLGYYSGYFDSNNTGMSNRILFKDNKKHNPIGMYVCNTAYATKCAEDGFFAARPFKANDTYILTAHGLNEDGTSTNTSATFYLIDYRAEKAQDRILNNRWEWFDLAPLGACAGFYLKVQSTDVGTYGDNFASYFAIDKLSVSPAISTSTDEIGDGAIMLTPNPASTYLTVGFSGPIAIYSSTGVKVYENENYTQGESINVALWPHGVYFVKTNKQTLKFIKQ